MTAAPLTVEARGELIHAVALGTWQLVGRDCEDAVAHALSIGYRRIDTAQIYGNETQVGRGLRAGGVEREQVFVTTKLGPQNLYASRVKASTEESLRRLGTDYVDLLLIHWPREEIPLAETLNEMESLRQQGLIRRIGVSNFPPSLLAQARAVADVFANQVECHPYLAQTRLLKSVRDEGLLLDAYCPLARGRVANDPVIARVAERVGRTPAQVTLRWLVQQGVGVIPKSARAARREENLALDDFSLDDADMRGIAGLSGEIRMIDPDGSPDWERSAAEP